MGLLHQYGIVDRLPDQAPRLRLLRRDGLAQQGQGARARVADQPGQEVGAARVGDEAETNSLDAQLDLERDLQAEAGRTPDYAEGVQAFLGKRPANFTGRR